MKTGTHLPGRRASATPASVPSTVEVRAANTPARIDTQTVFCATGLLKKSV